MSKLSRRSALKTLSAVPVAAGLTWTPAEADAAQEQASQARRAARAAGTPYRPTFFTEREWQTVQALVDIIIPRDERSGSATEAGVPEFIDFLMTDQPQRQFAMRGGLRWLDTECRRRFDRVFVECTSEQRMAVVEDIAWPNNPKPEFSHGVAFFSAMRDLTASGFWTSRTGIDDLKYMGNQPVLEWNGCPDAALKHLGIVTDDVKA